MSLKRYNLESDLSVPYMDEYTTGDWVRLNDVVKLLEEQMAELEPKVAQWSEPAYHAYQALKTFKNALIKGETNEQ